MNPCCASDMGGKLQVCNVKIDWIYVNRLSMYNHRVLEVPGLLRLRTQFPQNNIKAQTPDNPGLAGG